MTHPLAPGNRPKSELLTIMHNAARYGRLRWVLVFQDNIYTIWTEEDAQHYCPHATVIAQSHCDTCGALLSAELTAFCPAHEAAQEKAA